MYKRIVNLYNLLKEYYETLNKKVDDWEKFSKNMEDMIYSDERNLNINNINLFLCVKRLTSAVYGLGLTQIETQQRNPSRAVAGYYD